MTRNGARKQTTAIAKSLRWVLSPLFLAVPVALLAPSSWQAGVGAVCLVFGVRLAVREMVKTEAQR